MNINQIKKAVKYIQSNCPCNVCGKKAKNADIYVIASTKLEGLFEVYCPKCQASSIISVMVSKIAPEERMHRDLDLGGPHQVSQNDILDLKNFLSGFDGNFKKIFKK